MTRDLRQGGAAALAAHGYLDGPDVRCVLRGARVEIWRRSCRCAGDCRCWELTAQRPANDEDLAAFADAQRPVCVRAPAPVDDVAAAAVRLLRPGQLEMVT